MAVKCIMTGMLCAAWLASNNKPWDQPIRIKVSHEALEESSTEREAESQKRQSLNTPAPSQ